MGTLVVPVRPTKLKAPSVTFHVPGRRGGSWQPAAVQPAWSPRTMSFCVLLPSDVSPGLLHSGHVYKTNSSESVAYWRPAAATKHAANGEASTHGADIGGACRGAHRRLSHSPVCVHMGARGVTWEAAAVRAAEARAAAAAGRVQ